MTSVFCFAEDLLGEGIPAVVDRVRETGADSITLAATYHQARDVFPHHPEGMLHYLPSGSSAFQPSDGRYGLLAPATYPGGRDLLGELVEAASQRGMTTAAWTVVLHNSRLGHAHPEVTIHTALGDRLRHALCPAHPEVRRYATSLAADLAGCGVGAVRLEALTAGGFDHGETHERALIHLGEPARFLLGLCFCEHCRAAGQADDVDVETLAHRVTEVLRGVLRSHSYAAAMPPLSRAGALVDLLGEEITGYLRARERTVTSLAAAVAGAVHDVSPDASVVLLDPAGAALGYATGRPETEEPATALGWREGLDLSALSEHTNLGALCYFSDPARTARELAAYRTVLRPGANLEAVLRPTWPDVTTAAELAANVRAAREAGANDLHFYTYGLVRLESFDWMRHALSGSAEDEK